jgi:hypothetical protein
MASLFASGNVSEGGDGAVLGGLRLYFGQQPKTLIRRHREDDPILGGIGNVHRGVWKNWILRVSYGDS